MSILFLLVMLLVPAHSSQAFRGFYRFVKAPSIALGIGCSVFHYSFLNKMQRDYVVKLEETSRLQALGDPSRYCINPHVRAEIEQLCKERGVTLQFLIYDATLPVLSALAVSIDKAQGGIILGPGFGLGKDEQPCANPLLLEFFIGHELIHIIEHDIEQSHSVVSANSFVISSLWRLSTLGGKGRLFSLMVAFFGGTIVNVGRVASDRITHEYHADKGASQVPEVLIAGADYFDTIIAQKRKDAQQLVMRVLAGNGSERDLQRFEAVADYLIRAYITHPLPEDRAKLLRALAADYRKQQ